jgi:D-sedoheptulose 7-phosphate isomerase
MNVAGAAQACIDCMRKKILLERNGGADAQPIAGEPVSRFAFHRPGLLTIASTTNTSILTAIGNHYCYETVCS